MPFVAEWKPERCLECRACEVLVAYPGRSDGCIGCGACWSCAQEIDGRW